MSGEIIAFDPRASGEFHMVLTYLDRDPGTHGKSGEDFDVVRGRFESLRPDCEIVQSFVFESEDPAFAGTMRMTWSLDPVAGGTEVTIRCDNVPPGINPHDHAAGMDFSLGNLADFLANPDHDRT